MQLELEVFIFIRYGGENERKRDIEKEEYRDSTGLEIIFILDLRNWVEESKKGPCWVGFWWS